MMSLEPRSHGLLARFSRLSGAEAALLAEAMLVLAFSSAAIRFLPFAQVGRLASRRLGRARRGPVEGLAGEVAWAVQACARRVPWRAVCFQQGLASQIMLRRRGVDSTLYFGAAMGAESELAAHVWVKAGPIEIVGCREAAGFAVLATYPPAPGWRPQSNRIAGRGHFDPIRS